MGVLASQGIAFDVSLGRIALTARQDGGGTPAPFQSG